MQEVMRFNDKVAIVTGGAQGIGETYVRRLSAEGAAVVIADIQEELGRQVASDIRSQGGKALFVRCDVSDEQSCLDMARAANDEFGRMDCLVNNAAIFAGLKFEPLLTVDMAYYDRIMDVNVRGVLLATRATAPVMAAGGGGAIVNVSSVAAYSIGARGAYYGLSKLAVNGLTAAFATELGPQGIRVNSIAPGYTDTDAYAQMNSTLGSGATERMLADVPIKRLATTDDQANAVLFLLSNDAAFINGETLFVDGGRTRRI